MQQTVEQRIAAVEGNLRPSMAVAGQPVAGARLADRMAHYTVPAVSIAVLHEGQLDWAHAYGLREAGAITPVTPDSLFQAASISKPVAALAAVALVEAGQLDLDADVNTLLRSWKLPDNEFTQTTPVTLRRILSHTAGLTVHGFEGYAAGDAVPTTTQILDGELPANSDPIRADIVPGTHGRYSGGGYVLMQQLLEDVLGQPFAAICREMVLAPLGMSDSTYEQPLPKGWGRRAAIGHRSDGSPVAGHWHTYPEMAAAGLWTTPSDLARYILGVCRAWAGAPGSLIGQAVAHDMLTPTISGHGLGPVVGGAGDGLHFSHSGSNDGYRCFMVGFPARGDGAVIMTNSDSGNPLAFEIARSIAHVYGWPAFQTREKVRVAADPAREARYTGQYALDDDPDVIFTLTQDGDGLGMTWPGHAGRAGLHPESATDYFLTENGWQLRFLAEADQPATEFRLSSAEAGFADLVVRRVPADSAT